MEIDKLFENNSIDNVADNVFGVVNNSVSEVREMQRKKVAENVQLVVNALKKIEEDIREKYDSVSDNLEKRIISIKDGRDGINGRDGKDGKDGKQGKEGRPGRDGKDGKNGLNGVDGQDGVSVVNAHIDFDGSLIISLSSGKEINVGEVVAPALAEQIKVITNGGGTSQSVLDTLTSLQSQIDALSGATIYKGLWNASTNSPSLTSSVGTSGNFYIVSVAGSTSLNGITNWGVGDWAIFNGSVWQRVEGGADGNFTSLTVTGNTTLGDASTDTVTVNGYMGVGGAAPAQYISIRLGGTLTGFTSARNVYANSICASDVTAAWYGFSAVPQTAAAAFTLGSAHSFYAYDATKGAGSTITNLHGLYVADQTQGTNNYGITSLVSSGASKWNIYASGTANNVFAGNVRIGSVVAPTVALDVTGAISASGNATVGSATAMSAGGQLVVSADAGSVPLGGNYYNIIAKRSGTAGFGSGIALVASNTGFNRVGFGDTDSIEVGFIEYDHTSNFMRFAVSGSERLRIDSSGNVGIGTSSPSATDRLTIGDGAVANNTSISINGGSNDARGTGIRFLKAGTAVGFIGSASWLEGGTSDALAFSANSSATVAMRINSSGSVGIGVTPPTSSAGTLFLGANKYISTTGNGVVLASNYTFNAGQKYVATGYASQYEQFSGVHAWYTAPSGTAGNAISFTQAMTLDASGRLLIGSTSSNSAFGGNLQVEGTSGAFCSFVRYSTSAAGAPGLYLARSKGATVGTNTIVASGDTLGNLLFSGANGTGYSDAASISAFVDGTPGASADMPGRLVFSTSSDGSATPTERMRIDSSGNVGIGVTPSARNNTRLQIVDGIGFPATQVASSDANTLDDYEEGTFTPTIVGTSTAGTGTYSTQTGFYTKIGNRVYFSANLVWSAHTGTGNIRISGLPFTSGANSPWMCDIGSSNLTFSGQLVADVNASSTQVVIETISSGAAFAAVALDTAASIFVTGQYTV